MTQLTESEAREPFTPLATFPAYVHQYRTSNGEWATVTEDDGVTPCRWDSMMDAGIALEEFHNDVAAAVRRGDTLDHDRRNWRVQQEGK